MNPVQFRNSSDYISAGAFGADYTGATIDAGQYRLISMTVVNTATNRYVRFFWDYSSAGATSTVTVSYTLKS